MRKIFVLAALALVACSQNKHKAQSQSDVPDATPAPVVDQAREQKLSELMNKVGNVHAPSSAELVANAWCAVSDDELNSANADSNNLKFNLGGTFQMTTPVSDGGAATAVTSGKWTSHSVGTVILNYSLGPATIEQTDEVSLARSPNVILLKVTPETKESSLYRDCDLH